MMKTYLLKAMSAALLLFIDWNVSKIGLACKLGPFPISFSENMHKEEVCKKHVLYKIIEMFSEQCFVHSCVILLTVSDLWPYSIYCFTKHVGIGLQPCWRTIKLVSCFDFASLRQQVWGNGWVYSIGCLILLLPHGIARFLAIKM
jgi:hypothetical protein